jgi:hypothetical protein
MKEKRTSADSAGSIDGVEKERLRLINPVLVPVESLPLQKASKKELKFAHSIMELMLQIIKYRQKEHGGFQSSVNGFFILYWSL